MPSHVMSILAVYETEYRKLRSMVRRLVDNSATAEDLVQQAFANLLSGERHAPNAHSAYVAKAVRNLAFNYLRDTRRRAEVQIAESDAETLVDPAPSPETFAIHRSELRRLLEAIAALPSRRREAFVFNKIEELSYDEIAVRMKISRNTVISHVVAAMMELERCLPRG